MKKSAAAPPPVAGKNFFARAGEMFFADDVFRQRWFLTVVGLLGGWVWTWFFAGANFTSDDWTKEISYWCILKSALTGGLVPWRSSEMLQQGTDHFLTIPEVSYSPQVLLLRVLDAKNFVVVNLLLLYTVGYLGCCQLARRLQLSPFAFLFFAGLFNFNGYLTARFAVGHQMWESIFFYPWFFYYAFEVFAAPGQRKGILKLAAILWLVLLQGGIHQYVWCNLFLGLLFLMRAELRKPLLLAILLAALASSYRIVPAAWECWKLQHPFLTGYPSLEILVAAFTSIGNYGMAPMGGLFIPVKWWEFDIYVGFGGFFALIWFGLAAPKHLRHPEIVGALGAFGAAMGAMFFLSLADFYQFVHQLHLPLMNSEAVSARFIIVPFILLLLFAADALSTALKKAAAAARLVALLVLFGTGYQIYLHALVWRPQNIEAINHAPASVNPATILAGPPEADYRNIVVGSWIFTALAIGAIVFWWRQTTLTASATAKK
jgi:hypothetical protein